MITQRRQVLARQSRNQKAFSSIILTGRRPNRPVKEGENAVNDFIARYQNEITGVLSGFDRMLFRGTLRSLYALPVMDKHLANKRFFTRTSASTSRR
jgi:hypothetical protein